MAYGSRSGNALRGSLQDVLLFLILQRMKCAVLADILQNVGIQFLHASSAVFMATLVACRKPTDWRRPLGRVNTPRTGGEVMKVHLVARSIVGSYTLRATKSYRDQSANLLLSI
jgi:hypothetical protein